MTSAAGTQDYHEMLTTEKGLRAVTTARRVPCHLIPPTLIIPGFPARRRRSAEACSRLPDLTRAFSILQSGVMAVNFIALKVGSDVVLSKADRLKFMSAGLALLALHFQG
ncbi:unnamed protein product [Cercospora beticola]|nr:unnamed protein product [Cercospora beticola]